MKMEGKRRKVTAGVREKGMIGTIVDRSGREAARSSSIHRLLCDKQHFEKMLSAHRLGQSEASDRAAARPVTTLFIIPFNLL